MDYVKLAESVEAFGDECSDAYVGRDNFLAVVMQTACFNFASGLRDIAVLDGVDVESYSIFDEFQLLKSHSNRFGTPEELAAMPYNDFLKTRYWQIIRNKKLQSVGKKCELCAATGELHVHHKTYEHHGYELVFWETDLIVLCKDCHAKHHDKVAGAMPNGR